MKSTCSKIIKTTGLHSGLQMTRKEALRLKKQFERLTDQIQRVIRSPQGTLPSEWKKNMTIHEIQKNRLKLLVGVFYRTIDEALKKSNR